MTIEEEIETFIPELRTWARRYITSEYSEDALQNALIKIYTKINLYDQSKSLKNWLYTIVKNECLMLRRGFNEKYVMLIDDYKLFDEGEEDEMDPLQYEEDLTDLYTRVINFIRLQPTLIKYDLTDDFINWHLNTSANRDTFIKLAADRGMPPETIRTLFKRVRGYIQTDIKYNLKK